MSADDTGALTERIRAARSVPAEWARLREGETTREQIERHRRRMDEQTAALVAEEVRKGQAAALRGWALGVESELDASRAHGIDLGEWGRGLRSGVRQALQTADQIEKEPTR